jgi:hypothetical protein
MDRSEEIDRELRWSDDDRRIEVRVVRAEEPATNVDPDDTTNRGYRPPVPAAYGWRVVQLLNRGAGPEEGIKVLQLHEPFSSPESATRAAEEARAGDPDLEDLPIVPMYR